MTSDLMDGAFDWFFCSFIFITIFLPGGSIYGFNFKYPLYAALLPLAVYSLFRRKQVDARELALVLAVPAVLLVWLLLGLANGFSVSSVIRQYMDLFLTLLLCWLIQIFCDNQEARRLRFLRLVVNAEVATACLKLSLIAYAVLRGIPVVNMVMWLDSVFGVDLMTMDLGSLFGRVQFVSDGLIPVCIFIILRYRDRLRIGSALASLAIVVLIISVLFSFSRYFWAFTALAFLLGLALGNRDRFQKVLLIVLGISVIASLPALSALYEMRFSADVAGISDTERDEQIPALQRFFINAPLLGNGLGSYTNENIRGSTEAERSSYEVQLLALPAQIGLVGMFCLFVLGAYYYRGLWWKSTLGLADRIGIVLLLVFWIAAGLTNPLLLNPIASVNYAALVTLCGIQTRSPRSGHIRGGRLGLPALAP